MAVIYQMRRAQIHQIQRVRMGKGLTRRELGNLMGVGPRVIEGIEQRGANGLRAETAAQLADILGVRVRDLLD